MKIEIKYDYDPNIPPHFFAKSTAFNQYIVSAGYSWDEARKQHLKKLQDYSNKDIPKTETIEI